MTSNQLKVIFVGSTGVGKTSLINYFKGEDISVNRTTSTIEPVNYGCEVVNSRNIKVKLDLWDTAGQEEYQAISPMYYRNADVAVVCANSANINSLKQWIQRVLDVSPDCVIYIAITMSDLMSMDDQQEAEKAAQDLISQGLAESCFITSAKTGDSVSSLFGEIADTNVKMTSKPKVVELNNETNNKKNEGGCC